MAISERNLLFARNLIADKVPLSFYLKEILNRSHLDSEGKINCPIHEEDTPSFHYSDTRKRGNCFGCHAGGSVVEIHMHYVRKTNPQYTQYRAIVDLARKYKIELPDLHDATITDALRVKKSNRVRGTYSPVFYAERLKQIPRISINAPHAARFEISKTLDNVFLGRISAQEGFERCQSILRGETPSEASPHQS